jgi:hypothetical protein
MRISRERKPKGSRRALPLVGGHRERGSGALAGLAGACRRSWRAAPGGGFGRGAGLLVRSWWRRRPFDLPAPPWRMTSWARWCCREQLFLGWRSPWRWVWAGPEDSCGTVGPPRVNKTGGLGVAQMLLWGGSLLSVAPKPEMLRLTAARRERLARRYGGRILVYAPTERGLVEGARSIRFSPSSSTDPSEIMLRVESWDGCSSNLGWGGERGALPGGRSGPPAGHFPGLGESPRASWRLPTGSALALLSQRGGARQHPSVAAKPGPAPCLVRRRCLKGGISGSRFQRLGVGSG